MLRHLYKLGSSILLIFLLGIVVSSSLYAQDPYYDELEKLTDTSTNGSRALFRHVVRIELSELTNTNSNGIIGNYVGLSTKDKTLSFAYNFLLEESTLELNFSGAINDDIAGIFSEDKFKRGVELGFKYHKVFRVDKLALNDSEITDIREELEVLKNNLELSKRKYRSEVEKLKKDLEKKVQDTIKLHTQYKILFAGKKGDPIDPIKDRALKIEKEIITAEILLLDKKKSNFESFKKNKLDDLRKKRDAPSNQNQYKKEQFRIDSLKVLLVQNQLIDSLNNKKSKLKEIDKKINENTIDPAKLKQVLRKLKIARQEIKIAKEKYDDFRSHIVRRNEQAFNDKRETTLDKFTEIRADDIRLFWLSFNGTIANENYKLFDASSSFDDQISNKDDLIPSLGVSFSYYVNEKRLKPIFSRSRKITLLTVGANWRYGNNLGSLSEVQVETIDSVAVNRSVINSQKAFSGDFESEVETLQIFCDYYNVGWTRSNLGFHLRGTVDIGPHIPIYSVRGGLLFSARQKDKIKTRVNFEIFYGLNDLLKKNEEDNFLNRNILGIQTTVPFNF